MVAKSLRRLKDHSVALKLTSHKMIHASSSICVISSQLLTLVSSNSKAKPATELLAPVVDSDCAAGMWSSFGAESENCIFCSQVRPKSQSNPSAILQASAARPLLSCSEAQAANASKASAASAASAASCQSLAVFLCCKLLITNSSKLILFRFG